MSSPYLAEISNLYMALFGRAPDTEGLAYWSGLRAAGQDMAQVADAMFATAPARAYFPSYLSNTQIVASFYKNVLGREADAEGLAFWAAKMGADGATPGKVICEMVNTVVGYDGHDRYGVQSAELFNQRVGMAMAFAEADGDMTRGAALFAPPANGLELELDSGAKGVIDGAGYQAVRLGLIAEPISVVNLPSGTHMTLTASPQVKPVYTPGQVFSEYNSIEAVAASPSGYSNGILSLVSGGAIEAHVDMSGFQHLTVEAKDTDKIAHKDTLTLFDDGWNPSEWLTITGNVDLSLGAELYGVEFVDASLMLGDLDLYCSGYDVTTFSGSGDDTLTFSRMMSGSIFAGSGDDYIYVNGAGTTYLSGGSGADTFKFDAVGHLTTTIGDFSVARGDSMIFGIWVDLIWRDNPVKLGPGAAMVDYLNAAASAGATGSVTASWFQFDGDTYIVFDYYPDAQYMQVSWQDNQWKQDGCLKLVGLVDLHGLTIDNLWTV